MVSIEDEKDNDDNERTTTKRTKNTIYQKSIQSIRNRYSCDGAVYEWTPKPRMVCQPLSTFVPFVPLCQPLSTFVNLLSTKLQEHPNKFLTWTSAKRVEQKRRH
jgi:hypothetical protein